MNLIHTLSEMFKEHLSNLGTDSSLYPPYLNVGPVVLRTVTKTKQPKFLLSIRLPSTNSVGGQANYDYSV
jgi:hypothetical protein